MRFKRLLCCSLILVLASAMTLTRASPLSAEPSDSVSLELEGFLRLDLTAFAPEKASNPTDALWQLFSGTDVTTLSSITIRTTHRNGAAVVDVKLDGVGDPGIRALFYRGIVEQTGGGWVVTLLGRQHRCSALKAGLLPTWTTTPCT